MGIVIRCVEEIVKKRIEKKRAKKYICTKRIGNWQCDKCGWDSHLDASHQYITIADGLWKTIHCNCPVCGNHFSYME